jgi:hypothetical protein
MGVQKKNTGSGNRKRLNYIKRTRMLYVMLVLSMTFWGFPVYPYSLLENLN